ncbi:MAG: hypothetical protein CTY21_08300 [Methylomonas sp.]|nr:MAG: hypothetical protein CTY21_08300 [Methylomonas sp.]
MIVVDTQIATQPGVGFGIGSVIELLKNTTVGCMRFRVDIAQRSAGVPQVVANPADFQPKYTAFRFDMQDDGSHVIDKYEQIWCFGFNPDNNNGPDSNIDQPGAIPASNAELAKLASWMKIKQGGMFATGDHDYLGASMCRRIPRIGTMRRWTNADGVPPQFSPDRIDTLRPPGPAFEPGAPGGPAELANTPHQADTTIQPIQWVSWRSVRTSVFRRRVRPHPVLCHPTLGPIDVMPDHAHEGLCRDSGTVPLNGMYNFDGMGEQPEYPDATSGGAKPEPFVIAYGSTLGDPPYNFDKGPQPARSRFPMISVYDGHRAGVGRCATDSTWHHWMDVNILAIKGAGGSDWEKVKRYFINLATWLNPPGYSTDCLFLSAFTSHFTHVGFQEYSPKLSNLELGRNLYNHLILTYGPCWVTQWTLDLFDILKIRLFEEPQFPKIPDVCLTCPPFDLFEIHALGGLVRASLDDAALVHAAVRDDKSCDFKAKSLEDMMLPGVRSAIAGFVKEWQADLAQSSKLLKTLELKD